MVWSLGWRSERSWSDSGATLNVKCTACGEPVSEDARYCRICGAVLPEQRRCPTCGSPLLHTANFCPSCGSEVHESNDEEGYFSEAVAALADLTCPNGQIILYGAREKHPRRMEWRVRPDGAIPPDRYGALIESLQDISIREGYLLADVRINRNKRTCVWHVICGAVFGLAADHAVSVLLYYDSIWHRVLRNEHQRADRRSIS